MGNEKMKIEISLEKILLEKLVELRLIRKDGDRYFSTCVYGEEITIELKELFN